VARGEGLGSACAPWTVPKMVPLVTVSPSRADQLTCTAQRGTAPEAEASISHPSTPACTALHSTAPTLCIPLGDSTPPQRVEASATQPCALHPVPCELYTCPSQWKPCTHSQGGVHVSEDNVRATATPPAPPRPSPGTEPPPVSPPEWSQLDEVACRGTPPGSQGDRETGNLFLPPLLQGARGV